jgi:hypothetical protein
MIGDSLFTVLEIPYANALTMGQFDSSTTFDANTPVSHLGYSLQTLALYQMPGQTFRPDVIGYADVKTSGQSDAPPPGECKVLDFPCQVGKVLGSDIVKDYSKRVGLVLLAIILLALAIVSLR